jgi:plastocyanin
MISRLHTSSESCGRFLRKAWPVLGLALLCALPVAAATVSGSVRLVESHDPGVRKDSDYSGVVAWLERTDGTALPVQPKTAQMAQRKKHFDPSILALPVGSTVSFPNFDPIFHNAFSNFAGPTFDVGLYPPGTVPKQPFKHPGIVRVFCNIHPTMSAVIVVLDTPYIALSNRDGSFRMEDVKPGEYRLHLFHERATEQTMRTLERNLVVGDVPITLGAIEVSESGYIQTPHMNKYGHDYPAVIEDRPMYGPGKRQLR